MDEKYLIIDLENEKAKHLAGILGSKTCKKIINILAEEEASENDLAEKLNIPINTIEYNLKKLVSAGVVEKSLNWFWSKKGKKIPMYKLSNKSIVIQPGKSAKEKLKKILPAFLLSGVATILVGILTKPKEILQIDYSSEPMLMESTNKAMDFAAESSTIISPSEFPIWGWFLAGSLLAIAIYAILNWRKL